MPESIHSLPNIVPHNFFCQHFINSTKQRPGKSPSGFERYGQYHMDHIISWFNLYGMSIRYGPYHFVIEAVVVVKQSWMSKLLDHFGIFHPCPKIFPAWMFPVPESPLDCALLQRDFQRMSFQLENNNFQNIYLQ